MTALTITAAKVSADPMKGAVIRNYQTAATITVGKLVSLDSSGKLVLADGNGTAAVAKAIGICVAVANNYGETSVATSGYASVCVHGVVYGFSGLTPGAYGYVSDTAGDIEDTTSSTNSMNVGQAVAADAFFVRPGIIEPS